MLEYPSRQQLSSASDIGANAQGEDSAEVALRTEKTQDTPYPSSAIRGDITAITDVSSQSPSSQVIVDVAVAGPLRSSLDAEHTGGHPPHPPQG